MSADGTLYGANLVLTGEHIADVSQLALEVCSIIYLLLCSAIVGGRHKILCVIVKVALVSGRETGNGIIIRVVVTLKIRDDIAVVIRFGVILQLGSTVLGDGNSVEYI